MPACSKSDADECAESGNIRLSAAVGNIETGSRTVADPYLGTTPSLAKPLESAVWFRVGDAGVYEDKPASETNLPVHTGVTFNGPQLEFVYSGTNNLKYPTDNTPVYCVGLYPNDGGWTANGDCTKASHPIDGAKDLMFAGEIRGIWDDPFGSPLEYEHLLSWVKIAVCATSHDTAEAWGDIEQISINSKSGVEVDLKTGVPTYYNTGDTDRFVNTMGSPVGLQTTMHEVGSVLCSPETRYTLRVKTKNNPTEKEISLKLSLMGKDPDTQEETLTQFSDPSLARGKCFVLSLYFKPYNVIEVVCILNSWNNQSEDIYLTEN